MQEVQPGGSTGREQWESECVAAMLKRRRNVDRDDAKRLVRAAWSIERFRKLSPILAAEELLENPAVQPGTS
jgi:hypothetical protein